MRSVLLGSLTGAVLGGLIWTGFSIADLVQRYQGFRDTLSTGEKNEEQLNLSRLAIQYRNELSRYTSEKTMTIADVTAASYLERSYGITPQFTSRLRELAQ